MIRDITIGQYYAKESPVHALDPRTKLVIVFFYMVSMFCFHRFLGFVISAAFLGMVIYMSGVPFSHIVKGLKPLAVLLVFTMGMQMLFSAGDPLFHYGWINITKEGIENGFFMGIRLCLLVFGASRLTFTTTPTHLTDAIEKLFHGLNRFHIPVHEIAMMMAIALRFIPILLEETDKIMKAQMARGADFDSGGWLKKIKGFIPLLVPLLISAIRRANELAQAMEARCYRGGTGRTKMKPLQYEKRDFVAYGIFAGYLVVLAAAVKMVPQMW